MYYRRKKLCCPSKNEFATLECINCRTIYKPERYGDAPQEVSYDCPKCRLVCYKIIVTQEKKKKSFWDSWSDI